MTAPATIPVLSATEAAAWDTAARRKYLIPSRVLMESAGRAGAIEVMRAFPDAVKRGVLVVAGAGNNGGDGWVLARALHAARVPVWVYGLDPKTDDAIDNRALARVSGVPELTREEPWPAAAVA
ncbi:MAG TPA: NAD(P)H-hydrate epimerase, partial [Gemmatimonadales bacterium]|nr:NAD(P)H-hydrate epimerase [Gemmatimonadales bacterium]